MKKYKVISTVSFVWEEDVEAKDSEDAILKGESLLENENLVEYFNTVGDFDMSGIEVYEIKEN